MPEVTRHENGVPSWVDIGTPDVASSVAFYSELFGWENQDLGETAGHYTIASKGGKQVAGIGPAQNPGPPYWTTYVNVDDADATVAKVEGAGGTVVVAPMDVMSAGRMSILQDATGAFVGVWQPREHIGAQLVNEPGAFIWNDWLVYFGSADVDGDAEKAAAKGATLVAGPADIPGTGRFAVLVDPLGAAFALFKG